MHPETKGAIAQLVEQRTENPCVLGSIPSGTTGKIEGMETFLQSFSISGAYRIFSLRNKISGNLKKIRICKIHDFICPRKVCRLNN